MSSEKSSVSESRKKYYAEYEKYLKWRAEKEINNSRDEQTLPAYFQFSDCKSSITISTYLWSMYSKLKLKINMKEKFAITSFADDCFH